MPPGDHLPSEPTIYLRDRHIVPKKAEKGKGYRGIPRVPEGGGVMSQVWADEGYEMILSEPSTSS